MKAYILGAIITVATIVLFVLIGINNGAMYAIKLVAGCVVGYIMISILDYVNATFKKEA